LYIAIAYQPLIKSLIINEGVEAYIFNGANLMWPGVRSYEGLGEFSKDETVGIRNSKGEMIAIGAMGCGKKDLTDTSGVAVYILHYLGDKLWEMGTKTAP
jgi:predicted RNA-binding protein (TIGR00451 family)